MDPSTRRWRAARIERSKWLGVALVPLALLALGADTRANDAVAHDAWPDACFGTDEIRPSGRTPESVIVVVLDGVMWQDVFGLAADAHDAMPTLKRWMTASGAALGAPGMPSFEASGPNYLSLPGYIELFTGARSACQTNECVVPTLTTLVDGLGGDSVVLSSWETIGPIVRNPHAFVSAGRKYQSMPFEPAVERDLVAARTLEPAPGLGEFRPDFATAAIALDVVRDVRPRFLFVSLGEPDEYAHRGEREKYVASLRGADAFFRRLDEVLIETGRAATTTIFVTADHGRATSFRDHGAAWPESGRSWLVAKGAGIRARGCLASPMVRHLSNVAPTVRALLGAPPMVGADEPLNELTER